jgi:L-asparagine transporter-like permease
MKWEVFVKIILCLILQACVVGLLFAPDEKTRTVLYVVISNLAWITTAWSVYEDLKKPEQTQQVVKV